MVSNPAFAQIAFAGYVAMGAIQPIAAIFKLSHCTCTRKPAWSVVFRIKTKDVGPPLEIPLTFILAEPLRINAKV
jgi:hypothetical protein